MSGAPNELIEALEREWRDALCTKDMARLRTLVHPDFVLIGTRSTGPFIMHRDDWFEAINQREVIDIDIKVRDATMLPTVMVGTVRARWKIRYLGREVEDCVLLSDVWVHDEGRWRVIRRHSTPAPPNCTAY